MKSRLIRAIATVSLAVFAMCALCACGQQQATDFSGCWVLSEFDLGDGNVYAASDFEEMGSSGPDVLTMDLNADGSAWFTSGGSDPTGGTALTWAASESGDAVVLSNADGHTFEVPYDPETQTLSVEYQGQTITMAREQ